MRISFEAFRITIIKKDRQRTNGRDSEALRSRFTTQRIHAEFLGYNHQPAL